MSTSNNIDGMNAFQRALKRLGDIVGALFLLILSSPLFIVFIIVYKLTGSGPAFYTQERIGLHGRPFQIYKFRTMIVNAESEDVPMLEQQDDVRLLKYGKLMRSHHIDELPQLLVICLLWAIDQNVAILLTELWNRTRITNCCLSVVQA